MPCSYTDAGPAFRRSQRSLMARSLSSMFMAKDRAAVARLSPNEKLAMQAQEMPFPKQKGRKENGWRDYSNKK